MLTIRQPQMQALDVERRRRIEDDLVAHVRERLPGHYAALHERGTREAVAASIERALSRGLVTEHGIVVFTRLAFVLGADFDSAQPWARAVLDDPSSLDESERIERLGRAAASFLTALADS